MSSLLLLQFLRYLLISLEKTLGKKSSSSKISGSIKELLLVKETHIFPSAKISNYSLAWFRNYGASKW
jgi:hypothetical protein